MNDTKSHNIAPIVAAGIAVCCGLSALLAAAIGTTLLGLAIEAWVIIAAGLAVLLFLVVRHVRLTRS